MNRLSSAGTPYQKVMRRGVCSLFFITEGNTFGSHGPQAKTNVSADTGSPVESSSSSSLPPACRPGLAWAVTSVPPLFSKAPATAKQARLAMRTPVLGTENPNSMSSWLNCG